MVDVLFRLLCLSAFMIIVIVSMCVCIVVCITDGIACVGDDMNMVVVDVGVDVVGCIYGVGELVSCCVCCC